MTTRILPFEEYPRLIGTLLHPAWKHFDADSRVFVVERDGQIVRCVALFKEWRLDGVWAAESEKRSIGSGRALLRTVREFIRVRQIREVLMMARSASGRALCQKFGREFMRMDCDHYAVRTF